MVSFTRRTADLGSGELSAFVERFEATARDVVAAAGGRVVKTLGDAVLFVADDAATGALVALGLADRFGGPARARGATPVRVSLTWGRMLSRFGDVFGPPVTLAARLTDVAEPSAVWVSAEAAKALAADERFAFDRLAPVDLEGLGRVQPFRLRRA
jgi:adenylate cyclase